MNSRLKVMMSIAILLNGLLRMIKAIKRSPLPMKKMLSYKQGTMLKKQIALTLMLTLLKKPQN